jgi:hypothetical protein
MNNLATALAGSTTASALLMDRPATIWLV